MAPLEPMTDRDAIFEKIRAVGRVLLAVDLENSHSGNISMRWVDDEGVDRIAITATGSMKGDLTPDKVCYPTLSETNFGYFKASTETDIHAKVLELPGVSACVHAHTKLATVVTMEDAPGPKQNPRPLFTPLDPLGARYLGQVTVDWFKVASGSAEMTETLPARLADAPLTMIQEHGAIARGKTLEEALFYLCVMEHSGQVAFYSEMIGADLDAARSRFEELRGKLTDRLPDYSIEQDQRRDFADEPDTVADFLTVGARAFHSGYSPFHTGSMSLRAARTMLFAPKASMPHEFPGPLLEVPLEDDDGADHELGLHRALFRDSPFKALIHVYPFEVEVVAMESRGKVEAGLSRVLPIDAEGGFLYPAIPILGPDPAPETLRRALLDYRVAMVADGGLWSAGEQSLSEALRNVSSIKDVCFYRIMAGMRRLDLSSMEADRARTW